MGRKVLITGVDGYIGRQLAWYLYSNDYEVWGYDIRGVGPDLKPLLKNDNYPDEGEHFDAVIHLAAISSVPAFHSDPVNSLIKSLNSLYDALAISTDHFIFSSSAAATVDQKGRSDYGQMKVICEDLIKKNCVSRYSILRFHNVAGCIPESGFVEDHEPETHLIPNMILNKELTIYGDGSQIRDYIHVRDICSHISSRIQYSSDCLVQELGTGVGSSVLDVVRTYNKVTGKSLPIKFVGHRTGDVDELVSKPVQDSFGMSTLKTIIADTIEGYDLRDFNRGVDIMTKELNNP